MKYTVVIGHLASKFIRKLTVYVIDADSRGDIYKKY